MIKEDRDLDCVCLRVILSGWQRIQGGSDGGELQDLLNYNLSPIDDAYDNDDDDDDDNHYDYEVEDLQNSPLKPRPIVPPPRPPQGAPYICLLIITISSNFYSG